jgi:exonuclease III
MASIKFATLNINGITAPTRIEMLEAFLRNDEIDILLVQEVTQRVLHDVRGCNMHYNVRKNRRFTAIITREGISLENVTMLPCGPCYCSEIS